MRWVSFDLRVLILVYNIEILVSFAHFTPYKYLCAAHIMASQDSVIDHNLLADILEREKRKNIETYFLKSNLDSLTLSILPHSKEHLGTTQTIKYLYGIWKRCVLLKY